jgi:hypothetical protein
MTLKGHTIAGDELVFPSVVCLERACSFRDYITLDGWNKGGILWVAGERALPFLRWLTRA